MSRGKRWLVVATYAAAMAWVESAVVYYLRTMIDRIEPHQPNPLPIIGGLGKAEMVREAATILMLLMVGILAGRSWRARLGYTAIAFGVWDIFYYVFLRMLTGWPHSLGDWDILFLLPLPWWGPVLAPVSIALLMILWGTMVTQSERFTPAPCHSWKVLGLSFSGILVALFVFMSDAIRVLGHGEEAVRATLPTWFNWPLFLAGLSLMAAPIADLAWQKAAARRSVQ